MKPPAERRWATLDINSALAAAHSGSDAKTKIASLTCRTSGTDMYANKYDIDYVFNLGAPTVKFTLTRTSPVCNLTIHVTSGSAKTTKVTQEFKENVYQLQLDNLELATSKGTEEDVSQHSSADKTFTFPEGTATDGTVVIDFPTSKFLTVSVENLSSTGTSSFVEAFKAEIGRKLQEKIHDEYQDIRLELARVNSTPPPDDAIQLKPKSFKFAAFTPPDSWSDSRDTVLSIFIQTRDANKGEQDASKLSTAWTYLWQNTLNCSPIPPDQTASIIFGKDMIYESMIKPTFRSQGFTGSLVDSKGEIRLSVDTGKKVHADSWRDSDYVILSDGKKAIRSVDEINATPPNLTLSLHTANNKSGCRGEWTYDYHFGWMCVYAPLPKSDSIGTVVNGGITATHTLNHSLNTCAILDDSTLQVDCSITRGDWSVSFAGDDQSWISTFLGGRKEVPDWMKQLSVEVPSFQICFGKLDFFLTTNLLMPNRKVISIDTTAGLQIPGDFYVVGKVISNTRKVTHFHVPGHNDDDYPGSCH
ncbi:hypothetical protein UCREL1_9073 [Eutypa lata UCREL1]|uniref:Uncharacterized protein n=1 Tax=Eutypa lata (strain UCR-EL1) TaxID=1287681 RepID=M7SIH2_EUTLA|nr:hypothetical protein UCREL1_9073 [Eutypa lata UCREL1]